MGALLLALVSVLLSPGPSVQQSAGCATPRDACAFFDRYLSALNQRDFDAFRATFDDAITVMFDRPGPPERQDGRAAVETFFRRIFPPTGAQPKQLPPPIQPEGLLAQDLGDVVVISFHIRASDELARRTVILHRTPKGWRVVHIHGSSFDLPTR